MDKVDAHIIERICRDDGAVEAKAADNLVAGKVELDQLGLCAGTCACHHRSPGIEHPEMVGLVHPHSLRNRPLMLRI
jgi:hypothetical protein